ncbi:MAG: anthranilate synthase component II [Symbiobacteriia bacterium]
MLLVIDNYDSFTYNLVQALGNIGADPQVVRNDAVTLEEIEAMAPQGIVLSPGPGRPEDAGICTEVVRRFGPSVPTLGVCLGHQVIGEAFGGRVVRAPVPVHGKTSAVRHDGEGLFTGIPDGFAAARYHSLVVEQEGLPEELRVTARTDDGLVMGLRHRWYPVAGVQFHPESFLTPEGMNLLRNFTAGRL